MYIYIPVFPSCAKSIHSCDSVYFLSCPIDRETRIRKTILAQFPNTSTQGREAVAASPFQSLFSYSQNGLWEKLLVLPRGKLKVGVTRLQREGLWEDRAREAKGRMDLAMADILRDFCYLCRGIGSKYRS